MLRPAWYPTTTEPDWWATADASYPSPHADQIAGDLADQIGTGEWLTGLTDPARDELVKALTTAGCRFEEAASLSKEAHAAFLRSTSSKS